MRDKLSNRQLNNAKLNNKGFSLVELIVVMAVVVILSVAAAAVFLNSSGQKVTASTNIVANYLKDVMNYTMTGKYTGGGNATSGSSVQVKSPAQLTITCRDEGSSGTYYVSDGIGKEEKLQSGIKITYDTDAGGSNSIETGDEFKISFSRLNGSFNPLDDGSYVKYINIISAGDSSRSKSIRLYSKTGEYKIVEQQGDEDK